MRAFSKTAFIIAGFTALTLPAVAKDAPTKGRFEIKIIVDDAASGATERNVSVFKSNNHHEDVAKANLVFTHTDANDTVAEGFKDATAALHAKTKPLAASAGKVRSAGIIDKNLMQRMEECSELEDESEIQSCMMKAASGLQTQMQEKCKKDPSICAAMDDMDDEETIGEVQAGARDLQEAMTKFRFYTAESCTVDAAVDYQRQEEAPSELGGRTRMNKGSRTNGSVRGVTAGGAQPCTLQIAVGPDNAMSFSFVLSDRLQFPATHTNSPSTADGDKVRLLSTETFKNSYKVIKHKSASPALFSGEQTLNIPARTVKNGGWTTTSSSKAKVTWSIKLD